jgi:hypothetical protein
MTVTACLRAGFAAARRPKLIATLWAINLALAWAAIQPLRRWLQLSLDLAPGADLMARRFSFGLFAELVQDSDPALTVVLAAVGGAVLLAFLANPLLAGGTLEVLGSRDDRPFLHRFFRGGGHFYGRFLRLLLYSSLAAGVLLVPLALILRVALRPLRESGWEPGPQVSGLIMLAAVLTVLALFWMALDYARIQVSRDDSRRMWRALASGLRFTLRYRGRTFGLLAVTWLLLLVFLAAFLFFRQAVPSHTSGLILLMVLSQQAFMLARTWLRVATLGAERELHLSLRPAVGLATAPVAMAPTPWPEAEPAPAAAAAVVSGPSESPVEDPPPAPELSRQE